MDQAIRGCAQVRERKLKERTMIDEGVRRAQERLNEVSRIALRNAK